jgi:hypothetical protein
MDRSDARSRSSAVLLGKINMHEVADGASLIERFLKRHREPDNAF